MKIANLNSFQTYKPFCFENKNGWNLCITLFSNSYTFFRSAFITCNKHNNIELLHLKFKFCFSLRGTLLMEKCEQSRLEILNNLNSTVNATMTSINTTGMSALELDWLRGNATLNATRALPQCDIGKFITEVKMNLSLLWEIYLDRKSVV